MAKIKTPDWILKEEIKPSKKKAVKIFKIRKCPECNSREVSVILGNEEGKGTGKWECKKCTWKGRDIIQEEIDEEEFLKYLDSIEEKK